MNMSLALTIIFFVFIVLFLLFHLLMIFGFYFGAPFVPTSRKRLRIMLELAKPKPGELWIDLGSGDGRLIIAAARAGARAVGYEIHPMLVALTKIKIWFYGLGGRAQVKLVNFWPVDLSKADIISLYLIPNKMARLQKKLSAGLKPGCRVVSNAFRFPDWTPSAEKDRVKLYIR